MINKNNNSNNKFKKLNQRLFKYHKQIMRIVLILMNMKILRIN